MIQSTRRLWTITLAIGVLGTWLLFDAAVGLNWPIVAALGIAGLHVVLRGSRTSPILANSSWCYPLVLLLAGAAAVTANSFFHFWIAIAIAVLLAAATLLNAGLRAGALGPLRFAGAPFRTPLLLVRESGQRLGGEVRALINDEQGYRVARGVALALPVLAIFFLLLASADPTLAAWRRDWIEVLANLSIVPRAVFFVGLTGVLLGFYGVALREPDSRLADLESSPGRAVLSTVERAIVLGSVAGLFALFLSLQVSYLFGNPGGRPGSGLSYAEAVHRGFGELTIVVTLCAWLILACDRLAIRGSRERRIGLLGGLLVAECALLLASAWLRLHAYQTAYGYTTYRVYVAIYIAAAALALVALALEIGRGIDLARLTRRICCIAVLAICAPVYWNSAAWVVRRNLDRYATTGQIDTDYLAYQLSADGAPEIVASLPRLEPKAAARLVHALRQRHARDGAGKPSDAWFEWNPRRAEARAALATLPSEAPAEGVGRGR
jgi:two-component system sensor histidine kinase BaeS